MPLSKEQMQKALEQLPPDEQWRLFIDGYRQNEGKMAFDVREPGYMAGMERAFEEMKSSIDEPLSAELLIELHKQALTNVDNTDNESLESFRDGSPGDFGLVSNQDAEEPQKGNISLRGLTEFMASGALDETVVRRKKSGEYENVPKFEIESGGRDVLRTNTPEQIHDLVKRGGTRFYVARESAESINVGVNQILKNYHNDITQAKSPDDKLNAIVKMVSTLERGHIFTDGNARTMVMLTLNRELVKNGFTPVILENPNRFDLFSCDELKGEISKGMQTFWHYVHKAEVEFLLSETLEPGIISSPPSPYEPEHDQAIASSDAEETDRRASPVSIIKTTKEMLSKMKEEDNIRLKEQEKEEVKEEEDQEDRGDSLA